MIRNTLKRVMLGLVLIDNETGAVFDKGPYSKDWKLITNENMARTLKEWGGAKAIIGQNITFKAA